MLIDQQVRKQGFKLDSVLSNSPCPSKNVIKFSCLYLPFQIHSLLLVLTANCLDSHMVSSRMQLMQPYPLPSYPLHCISMRLLE